MSTPTIKIYNQQSQIDVLIKSFQGPVGPQGNGLSDAEIQAALDATKQAQNAAAQADAAREGIEGELSTLKDTKADAITDVSSRAASHTLHAQRGPLGVTLYGKTTEKGSGDKSPDNPYEISGVDAAQVHAGSKNLIPNFTGAEAWGDYGLTATVRADGAIILNGTTTKELSVRSGVLGVRLQKGVQYTLSNEQALPAKVYLSVNNNAIMISPNGTKKTASVTEDRHLTNQIYIWASVGAVFSNTVIAPMLVAGTEAVTYEPYLANVINPPLLPDGSPLMGNGTVDDEVENDALSGCDKKIVLDGSETWKYHSTQKYFYTSTHVPNADDTAQTVFSERYAALGFKAFSPSSGVYPDKTISGSTVIRIRDTAYTDVDSFAAYLAANPLTVYYRSTDYTPDKDLRVCRTVRRWKTLTFTGEGHFSGRTDQISWDSVESFPAGSDGTAIAPAQANQGCNVAAIGNASSGTSANLAWVYTQNGVAKVRIGAATLDFVTNGGTLEITYPLATPETYMTDPLTLRKPDTLTTDTVTVTGSGETAVEYPHDTKHYIDQKFDALAAALLSR